MSHRDKRSFVLARVLGVLMLGSGLLCFAARAASPIVPDRKTATPIQHLIVIIGENQTFDGLFATYVPKRGETVHNLLSEGIVKANGEPGPASSVSRLFNTSFEQELHEFAMEMLGPYGLLGKDPDAVQRGRWVYGFLRTRASTIGAGTSEIQLNTVAEQVLKLPRDPRPY